jgi:hypothetical protein
MISAEKIIELKELRIGNILNYDGDPVHVTFLSMDIDDEYQDIIGFCKMGENTKEKADWNRALAGQLDRIPLTAEWLQRLGFDTQDYEIDIIEWATEGRALDFAIDQIGVPPEKQPFIFSYDQGMGDRKVEIKYVHQLQNLYFALTGEELTVKALV